MDGLDLLKKNWNKKSGDRKLSVNEIYSMLQKKSSSIVKTLFYISIAEFIFWILLSILPYFFSQKYKDRLEEVYSDSFLYTAITAFGFLIIIIFVYLLYKSYKSISITDNAKKLMENILKTRKIIKYYVLYNLIVAGISMLYAIYDAFNHDSNFSDKLNELNNGQFAIVIAVIVAIIIVFIVIVWLFYLLIYGLLLKRLNRNYTELKKMEL